MSLYPASEGAAAAFLGKAAQNSTVCRRFIDFSPSHLRSANATLQRGQKPSWRWQLFHLDNNTDQRQEGTFGLSAILEPLHFLSY